MTGRLKQFSGPRMRQQAGIGKSQTPVERDILVQWVRKNRPALLKQNKLCVISKKTTVNFEECLSLMESLRHSYFFIPHSS